MNTTANSFEDIKSSLTFNIELQPNEEKQKVRLLQKLYNDKDYMSKEKKWLLSLFIALFTMCICSSFTLSLIDSFLSANNITLFAETTNSNEIILNCIQFFIILLGIRIILNYY
jgi:hypothetical protein